jgi:hypothetical protein
LTPPRPYLYAAAFVIASSLLISRQPGAFSNAQFWAEDGKIFYASAYNHGAAGSIFEIYSGYLHVLARVVALCSLAVPLCRAPLLLNSAAVMIQALPAVLLVSPRLSWIGNLPTRLLFGFLYLALPNSWELHDNLTNSQWHFAFLAFLVLTSGPAVTWIGRCLDVTVLGLFAFSGPFALMLFPFGVLLWWRRRDPRMLVLLAILACGAFFQSLVLLFSAHPARSSAGLGATPALLFEMLADHVFLGTLSGSKMLCNGHFFHALPVVVIGVAVLWYAAARGPLELKLFLGFAALVLGASLVSPTTNGSIPSWLQLERSPGIRYWFLPMLAVLAAILRVLNAGTPLALRVCAAGALCYMSHAIYHEWRDPPFPDLHFRDYSRSFEQAPPGTAVTIPLNPPGWSMQLIKR